MGVYIKGLKIPPSGQFVFVLTSSGMVENVNGLVVGEAVEVKAPHGDLIERVPTITKIQKIEEEPQYQHDGEDWINGLIQAEEVVRYAPTIIEAEGKDDG